MNMSTQKRIKVTVDQMGNPRIEAENFFGGACEAATAPIEKALSSGGVVRDLKESYYQQEEAGAEQHQTNW